MSLRDDEHDVIPTKREVSPVVDERNATTTAGAFNLLLALSTHVRMRGNAHAPRM